jgi:hypothetical protein
MQFGILPLHQGSSAHSCMQFGILLMYTKRDLTMCVGRAIRAAAQAAA